MKPNVKITRTADGKEQRSFSGTIELRAAEAEFAISGTAAAYNVRSAPIGGEFVESIAPGAFSASLSSDDIVCCFNHDFNQLLGRKSSGTLKLTDGKDGLQFRCQLDRSNPTHNSVYASVKRGDLNGCSFQFTVQDDDWKQDGATILRTLKKVKLYELGPVVFPAYPQGTSVGARAEQRSNYVLGDWRAKHTAALAKLERQIASDKFDTILEETKQAINEARGKL